MTRKLLTIVVLLALAAPASAGELEVVPLLKGQGAPFSGLLVPEAQFTQMLRLRIDLDETTYKLALRERLFTESVATLQQQLGAAQADLNRRVQPTPWWKSHSFLFVVGFVVGTAATIGAVLGAAQLTR